MTVLVCFAIVLFGAVAFRALPVAALPSVDYPTIQVNASLPGASPETMASTVATPLEREFSTIAGIQQMSSTNSQGSTSITVQFSLGRNIDAAAQDVQAAHCLGRRPAAAQHAAPAVLSEGESGRAGGALPNGGFRHAAAVHRDRVRGHHAGAAHLHGWRRLAGAGLRRAEVRGAGASGSGQAGRGQHRYRRSAARHRGQQHQSTHRPVERRQAGLHHRIERHAGESGRLPPHHRGLAQRHAGAAGAIGQRDRQRREQQGNRLDEQRSRGDSGDRPAAGDQHGGSGGQHPPSAAGVPAGASAFAAPRGGVRHLAIHPQLDSRRRVHAAADRLHRGDGHFPVPAQHFGHPDSRRGGAILHRGHVRGDVPARLQSELSLVDGADALGGVRGG